MAQRIDKLNIKIALAMLIIVLLASLSTSRVGEIVPVAHVEAETKVATTTKPVIKKSLITELPPIFLKISWCESKNKQFNSDKTVHRGVQNPQDVGKYQINEGYHLRASQALGIDIYTLEGNTEYALVLYKANGTRDWNWSKWCWDDQTVSTSTWEIRYKQNITLKTP